MIQMSRFRVPRTATAVFLAVAASNAVAITAASASATIDQRWLGSHRLNRHYTTNLNGYIPTGEGAYGLASPTLGQWIVPALLCALAYALYNIFIKKGSYSINPVLGGVILQFVAALLGSLLLLSIAIQNDTTQTHATLQWDWRGVQWAICAGVSVGLAEMISFFVSGMGVPAVQTIPIIIGGSVMFGTLLGMLLLGESLQWNGWLGVLMLIAGICLVGIDPGARHAHS